MSVRCAKCGEELLGAVNRCWKCGQAFARHADDGGLPPVRLERPPAATEPLEAIVIEDDAPADALSPAAAAASAVAAAAPPAARPFPSAYARPPVAAVVQHVPRPSGLPPATSQIVEARRRGMMATGGTVGATLLAVFALCLAPFRAEAAIIGLVGLSLGIWGLYSPQRRWALAVVLLCCLGIGLGVYRGAYDWYVFLKKDQVIEMEDPAAAEEDPFAP